LRNVVGCCVATRFRELHKFNIRRCAGVGVMGHVLSTRLVAINVPWVVTRATKSFASHASLAIVQSSACPRCTASIMVTICELRLTSFSRRSMRLSRPSVAGKEPVAMTCHRYESNAARKKSGRVRSSRCQRRKFKGDERQAMPPKLNCRSRIRALCVQYSSVGVELVGGCL
jgi:hypothetical protein